MSNQGPHFSPKGTPGYTGIYRWRGDLQVAMRPDGTWAPLATWDLFLSKRKESAR